MPFGGRIESEDRQLAAFLREQGDAIARLAARNATKMLPIGGAAARRGLTRIFADHVQEFARLLDTYGEGAPRLFGELLRAHAMRRRAEGLSVRDAIEEEAHLLEAVMEVWGQKYGRFPPMVLRPLLASFTESSGQVADVWVNAQRAESAGFQEAMLLETIVHHLDEAIIVVEADGTISFATPAIEEVLGVSPRVLIGLRNDRLIGLLGELKFRNRHGQPFQEHELPASVALNTGRPVFEEGIRILRPGGEHAVLEVYAAPVVDEENELRGAIVTIRDRTENARQLEALEMAFREVREMQTRLLSRSRMEAVGELAGSAAHALNNQLQVLDARSRRLLDIPEAAEEAEAITKSVREITKIVGRLQEFAAVREPGKPRPTDLPGALQTALALTRTQFAPGSGTGLETRIDQVPEVLAEEELLVEFVTAILLGAKEAVDGQGVVHLEAGIRARRVEVRIIAENVGRIDDPDRLFEALEAGADQHRLSLAVARQAVRRWGGELGARREDKRLIFEMRLPPARERDVTEEEASREAKATAGVSEERVAKAAAIHDVLVVDDDADNAAVLAEFLMDAGAEAATAGDAAEALALARQIRPQAALVDLLLPDSTGWEVARRLREEFPGIRIAVVSGLAAESEPEAAEVDAVFRKPVDPPTVLSFLGLGSGLH